MNKDLLKELVQNELTRLGIEHRRAINNHTVATAAFENAVKDLNAVEEKINNLLGLLDGDV